MRNRPLVYLYVLLIASATLWMIDVLLESNPIDRTVILGIVFFAMFVLVVEFFEIEISTGYRLSSGMMVYHAAWMVFPPSAAMILAAIATLIGDAVVRRRPVIRAIFNAGSMAICSGVAGIVFHAMPMSDDLSHPGFLVPAIVSHVVSSSINVVLAASVMALAESRRFDEVVRAVTGWHFVSGAITAPLSAFLVFSYEFAGLWSLALFALPIAIVHQAHRIFEQMKKSHKETVAALTTALEADEPYTHGHSHRVAKYAVQVGRRLNLSPRELETLEYAGLLHDIGKIAITNDIVCKPARLSKDEFDILSAHPAIGGEIVEQMEFLSNAADMVRHHHERPDGQGYPDGLKGEEISLGSHILNLCDAIDAMCSNRPYRAALTLEQCVAEVRRFRGAQFDERVVDTFVDLVEEGSFELIQQNDDTAQAIQRVVREAAARAKEQARRQPPVEAA